MIGCLYMLSFQNGKAYVGVTFRSVAIRFKWHAPSKIKPNVILHKAIAKYGRKTVEIKVLVIARGREYLFELEKRAIIAFGTKVPFGYNMTDGGEGGLLGMKHSEESRAKMKQSQAKRWTPAARLKQSQERQNWPYSPRKGVKCSLETRVRMSVAKATQYADRINIPHSKFPREKVQ